MARGQKIATAFLELGVDDSRLDQDMSRTKQKVNSSFMDLGKAAAAGFAAFGFKQFADFGVKMAAQTEVAMIGFEVLTGSAEQAKKTFNELKTFSDFTPFEGDEVQKAGKKLLAAGVDVSSLTEKLGFLGDASAAVDANLNEVVSIYSKIRNQNKLTGETFEQLAERSINLAPIIQRQLGITADKFIEMRAAGQITTDIVENAFRSMNSEGGKFFGAMDKLSQTYEGRLSTLRTRFADVARTVGDALLPAKKALAEVAIKILDAYLAMSPELQKIVGIMIGLAPAIFGVVAAFKAMKFAGIGAAVGIRAALAATGVGILLPLIGFVIAKFLDLAQTVEFDFKPVLEALSGPIKKLQRAWEVAWEAINTIVRTVTTAIKTAFGALFDALGVDIGEIKDGFIGFVTFAIDLVAEFVLSAAEWFNVIVHNWDTAMKAMGDAARFMWSAMGDLIRNFIPAAWELIKGFAMSVVEVFKSIPKAIKGIFQGGGIAGALDDLFAEATAKFAASQVKAFSKLLTPSEETRRLSMELAATLAKLAAEKKKLEAERNKVDEEIDEAEEVVEEAKAEKKTKKEAVKEKVEIEFGRTGLTDFANEVQDMFLKNEADDKQAKIVDLNQAQVDIQDEALGVNKEIRDELKNAAVIKVAGQ